MVLSVRVVLLIILGLGHFSSFLPWRLVLVITGEVLNVSNPGGAAGIGHFLWCLGSNRRPNSILKSLISATTQALCRFRKNPASLVCFFCKVQGCTSTH